MTTFSFAQLSEKLNDSSRPRIDRADVDITTLDRDQRNWHDHGYVVLDRFMPDALIDAYCAVRERAGQWPTPIPYQHVPEIRDICLYRPLLDKLRNLIGDEMAMHLNLTNWTSTERNWHQDDYLNPPTVNGYYTAVWMALDDIHPDSGPFQFVPGSHRWPVTRGRLVRRLLPFHQRLRRDWPTLTEPLISRLLEDEIAARGGKVQSFTAKRGDVLIWHSCLVHRGSLPRQPGMPRKALITHYTAISRGTHFPAIERHGDGWYFRFGPRGTNRARGWLRQRLGLKHRIPA